MQCRPLEAYISDLCCLCASSCMLSTNQDLNVGPLISMYCSPTNTCPVKFSFIGQLCKIVFIISRIPSTHMHICSLMPTHICPTCIHTSNFHPYIHAYVQHAYIHTYVQHAYIHTYFQHTYIHTYTHTYIHVYMNLDPRCCNPTLLNEGRIQPSRPSNVRWSVKPWTRQCMSIASIVHLTFLSFELRSSLWLINPLGPIAAKG